MSTSGMSDSSVAAHGEAHNPALLHHFATAEQQKDSSNFGMWIFLATEVMFFGGLFCAYLIYRGWYFGDFAAASKSFVVRVYVPAMLVRVL